MAATLIALKCSPIMSNGTHEHELQALEKETPLLFILYPRLGILYIILIFYRHEVN